jgi:monothiol glutaredoxin
MTSDPAVPSDSAVPSNTAVKTRIDQEVKQHKIVIYMKGNVLFPQCGFSARVVELLQPFGPLHTVDVLKDQSIRQGIKDYSQWPTIPQVFINGQFVGGCDIVTELSARGELAALVAGES